MYRVKFRQVNVNFSNGHGHWALVAGIIKLMIVSFIIKLIVFYFAFLLIKNLWKGYRVVSHLKDAMGQGGNNSNPFGQYHGQQGKREDHQKNAGPSQATDIEAEFRHIDPK